MTDKEIFEELREKTADLEIPAQKQYQDLNALCRLLTLSQLTKRVIEGVDYKVNRETFERLFSNFSPKAIVGSGKYLVQLNNVLDEIVPEKVSPYKDFTHAVLNAARYLSQFEGFNDYRKELYLKCQDEETTLKFMNDFRMESGIATMYFVKTCSFFSASGLLDVPVLTEKVKKYLMDKTGVVDDNDLLYKKAKQIADRSKVTCHELCYRIESME